jgi:methionyl-tRNA synthetase
MTRYLVTSALPYANGPIHFGQVTGAYLPADVYVRTLRMQGEDVVFICGTDEHGTAITVNAEQEDVPYADYVRRWRDEIKTALDRFSIRFDHWSGTSLCPETNTNINHCPQLIGNFANIEKFKSFLNRHIQYIGNRLAIELIG